MLLYGDLWVDIILVRYILKEMRFTAAAAVLGIALILTAALTNIDLVKLNLKLLDGIEKNEVDDIVSSLTLIFVGLTMDRVFSHQRRLRRQHAEIEAQKLRTLKATMRTVQDIVNNFLNTLMLFEIAANGDMPHGSLETIEELIQDTSQKLKALGDLDSVVENSLAVGIGIEYPHS